MRKQVRTRADEGQRSAGGEIERHAVEKHRPAAVKPRSQPRCRTGQLEKGMRRGHPGGARWEASGGGRRGQGERGDEGEGKGDGGWGGRRRKKRIKRGGPGKDRRWQSRREDKVEPPQRTMRRNSRRPRARDERGGRRREGKGQELEGERRGRRQLRARGGRGGEPRTAKRGLNQDERRRRT